jgi:hypothetical protein
MKTQENPPMYSRPVYHHSFLGEGVLHFLIKATTVKSEPDEARSRILMSSTTINQAQTPRVIKTEATDLAPLVSNFFISVIAVSDASQATSNPTHGMWTGATDAISPRDVQYTIYSGSKDIVYTPEASLKEGLAMVKTLEGNIQSLKLGSKLREDVWKRELSRQVACEHHTFTL